MRGSTAYTWLISRAQARLAVERETSLNLSAWPYLQNRYKSIVVEEAPYLLELVRDLHLNPLRAGTVTTLPTLTAIPGPGTARCWAPSAVRGNPREPSSNTSALPAVRPHGLSGVCGGRQRAGAAPELQGGGLVRSLGAAVAHLRRGREAYAGDERILGSSTFVEALQPDLPPPPGGRRAVSSMEAYRPASVCPPGA